MLPPEINSARMYAGPGARSLIAAVAAWESLADELTATADGYSEVLSCLTGLYWWGPASSAMCAAAAPFVAWLRSTSARARRAAQQVRAAVAAFEQAYATTVPPAAIAANRTQLASLIETNIIGQNASAIAATEMAYAEMWAQDAATMYNYAANSALATRLTPYTPPPQLAGAAGSGAMQTLLTEVTTRVPAVLDGLSLPQLIPDDFQEFIDLVDTVGSIMNSDVAIFTAFFATLNSLRPAETAAAGATGGLGEALSASLSPLIAAVRSTGSSGVVAAGLSKAKGIGQLSVPPSWAASASAPVKALPVGGFTILPGAEPVEAGMPGVPGLPAGSNRGANGVVPRYGRRLTVMPRPPAAG